jgi:hypothetical protein
VALADAGVAVMTDFAHEHPISVTGSRRIEDALEDIIRFGMRALPARSWRAAAKPGASLRLEVRPEYHAAGDGGLSVIDLELRLQLVEAFLQGRVPAHRGAERVRVTARDGAKSATKPFCDRPTTDGITPPG